MFGPFISGVSSLFLDYVDFPIRFAAVIVSMFYELLILFKFLLDPISFLTLAPPPLLFATVGELTVLLF